MNINEKVKLAVARNVAEAERKAVEAAEVAKDELVHQAVNVGIAASRNDFIASVNTLIPAIIDSTKQNPDKIVKDFPIPIFVGSNSVHIAPSPALATAHVPASTPAPAVAHSSWQQ